MRHLDRRLHAARPDLADEALRGRVDAQQFTAGQEAFVRVEAADLRPRADASLGLDTQLLFGERVTCFERRDGWAWVKNHRDGYVGYLDEDDLGPPPADPTHEVRALRTFRYPRPDLKAPILGALSITSPVHVIERQAGFASIEAGGWVFERHLAPLQDKDPDPVATALGFLGLPYRWGGRSSMGLDCSALVQLALHRAGVACPRDSDMQRDLGVEVDPTAPPERGDVVLFHGHVALALDAEHVVHATAHGMCVRTEPLAEVIARLQAETQRGILAVRRVQGP